MTSNIQDCKQLQMMYQQLLNQHSTSCNILSLHCSQLHWTTLEALKSEGEDRR